MRTNLRSRPLLVLALVACASFAHAAHAATLSFTSASAQAGQTVSVSVIVAAEGGESLNGVSARVTYPTDKLTLLSLSKAGSVITFWAEEPSFSNAAGTASIEGIIPSPGYSGQGARVITLVFQAKAPGSATLSFQNASVLANDGRGTNILTGAYGRTLTISSAAQPASPPPSTSGTPAKPKPGNGQGSTSVKPAAIATTSASTTATSTPAAPVERVLETPRAGSIGSSLWDVPVFILALLGLAALGIISYYGWPVFAASVLARRAVRRTLVNRSFALLRKDLEEHMAELRTTADPLTPSELEFLDSFEKDLKEVEKLVASRLKGLPKGKTR